MGQDEIGALENGQITELRILGESHGAEIGSAVAIELGSRTLILIHNMRGDICCLIDSKSKEIIQNCQFSAFGEQSTESIIPWGFSSKRLDPETGFIYFGRRYYSPSLGRWITPDPIGFRDGPNLYAYVHNSPLTHFDLYGLEAVNQMYDYRFNYSLSQYSPLKEQRWSSFDANLNFKNPFAYDRFEYRSTNGSNYLKSAIKGCGHGALNFAVRSLQNFHTIGTHVGAEVMESNCHDKCNIFGSLDRYQANQLNVVGQYYRNIVSASVVDPVYQSYCSGTELTLEIGSLVAGGCGAIKGGYNRIRGLKFFGNASVSTNSTLTPRIIKKYLSNLESIKKSQLIADLESIGLKIKGRSPDGKFIEFVDKYDKVRIKIHPPDKVTNYDHLHIYDKFKNSLNKDLNIVDKSSIEAHIPYGGN